MYDNGCVVYRFKVKDTNKTYAGGFQLRDCGDRYEIWALWIDGRRRNKGYGTQMLSEFLTGFKHDKPLILYVLKGNAIAIHLYEKVGFRSCKEWKYSDGVITMKYEAKS